MQAYDLYQDIAQRTQGDVYVGVVGPVRTGKSTFIRRLMEKMIIPAIENAHIRARAQDDLPQSGSGRTVMTTKPAFIPSEAVDIALPSDNHVRLRFVDSVGYMVEGALGTTEGEALRMVRTPWGDEEMPFERAAELGTQKVITEHSTIGLVVTTDGSVTDLPRTAYISGRGARDCGTKKPRKTVCDHPEHAKRGDSQDAKPTKDARRGSAVPVVAMNVEEMDKEDIRGLLEQVLGQFPVVQMNIQTPEWLGALDETHWLVKSLMDSLQQSVAGTLRIGEADAFTQALKQNEYLDDVAVRSVDHGSGCVGMQMVLKEGLFNQVLAEQCGTEIRSDAHLLALLRELVAAKKEYDHVAQALQSVRETGYGLVPPQLDELTLQEPEIMGKGGKFGVRLRASAPSLHLIRVDIQTEVSPVVGTEQQSEEMLRYLMEGFEQDPQKLWQSNLFGKPLSDLVREGLSNKLMHMPEDTQLKVQQTLEKIINEGNGGMVCILL